MVRKIGTPPRYRKIQQLITLRESTVKVSAACDSLIKSRVDLTPILDLLFRSITFQANLFYWGCYFMVREVIGIKSIIILKQSKSKNN